MSKWTVWVGGGEMDNYIDTLEEANFIAESWRRQGYDDVVVEEVA